MRHRAAILGALVCSGGGCAEGAMGSLDEPPALAGTSTGSGSDGGSETVEPTAVEDIDTYVYSLGHLELDPLSLKAETPCVDGLCPQDGQEGDRFCTYVHYDETSHRDALIAFAPNSATLWPGAVVRGDDARHGILTPISLPRAPMTFSFSLENLANAPVATMDAPSPSNFRAARHAVLAGGVTGSTPAALAYELRRAYAAEQIANHLGFGAGWPGGNGVTSMFDWSNQTEHTKVMVNFTQAYYTIDVDPPASPSALFTDEVTVEDLQRVSDEESPPMYVQSITYGRRVIFAIESRHSEHEVATALEMSIGFFLGWGFDVEAVNASRHVIDESKIEALILGGSGAAAVKAITGLEGLSQFLLEGGDYSKDSPGAEIGYKLAYLDNTGVTLAFTTDWSERQCFDTHADVRVELAKIRYNLGNDDGPGPLDIYGNLRFRIGEPGEPDPCSPEAPGWHTVLDNPRGGTLVVFSEWSVPAAPAVELYDVPIDENKTLCLRGALREADYCWFCSDDDFGEGVIGPIPMHEGWAGDHTVQFTGAGHLQTTLRVTLD